MKKFICSFIFNTAALFTVFSQSADFVLEVSIEGKGTVSPKYGTYMNGEAITIIAEPEANYKFKKWIGSLASELNPLEIIMDDDKTLTAIFIETDTDQDGVPDVNDVCPETLSNESVDGDGCSTSQKDVDGDGIVNENDECPNTPDGEEADKLGCSKSQRDSDGDGIMDSLDLCPETPANDPVDGDGCSRLQKDADNDGVSDEDDLCPDTTVGAEVDENGCEV